MSGAALAWAKSVTAPSKTAKAVLICLADYADADAIAWPAIKRLMAEVQCSESTVQRSLRALEWAGLVVRAKGTRKDGGETSARYQLRLPPSQNDCPPQSKCDPPGVTGATPPVSPTLPPYEPLLEPQAEPNSADASKVRPRKRTEGPAEFEAAWTAYPHVLGRSSKPKTLAIWRDLDPAVKAQLVNACRAYALRGATSHGGKGAPAMDRWLRDEKFVGWLHPDKPAVPLLPPTAEQLARRERHYRDTGEWRPDWGVRPQAEAA